MEQVEALARTLDLADKIFQLREVSPDAELRRYHGKIPEGMRPGFVITASIKSSGLTLTEMGDILDAITDRICRAMKEYPELEETAHDLSLSHENFIDALNKIDDRLARG